MDLAGEIHGSCRVNERREPVPNRTLRALDCRQSACGRTGGTDAMQLPMAHPGAARGSRRAVSPGLQAQRSTSATLHHEEVGPWGRAGIVHSGWRRGGEWLLFRCASRPDGSWEPEPTSQQVPQASAVGRLL
jgi:hypothetical protein